jgi:streptogramin lyase
MVRRCAGLTVLVLLVLAVIGVASPALAQVQQGATLTVLRGQVAVIRTDGTAVQPAPSGTVVNVGDELRTLGNTGALITFFAGTEIELAENTILVVDEVNRQGDKINISLRQVLGASINRVQTVTGSGSSYRIEVGGAVALVRGTEFAVIGPVTTSVGDIVILVCLADCSPASTFAGCPLQPFLGYGVVVGRGRVESDCLPFAVARGANLLSAAFEAITTIEQQVQGDTRGVPAGQVSPGQREETATRSRQRERKEDEDDKCSSGQTETPGGFWEAVALVGAGAAPGQLGPLLSPVLILALGRSRGGLRRAAPSWRWVQAPIGTIVLALALSVSQLGVVPGPVAANHIPLAIGDVLVAVGSGTVNRYSPSGTFIEALNTTSGSAFETGMCSDTAGNVYVTNFTANSMTKLNNLGGVLQHPFGSGFNARPESCVVDAASNIYVGQADGSADVLKFSPSGTSLASFSPATQARGTDWIELAADQCTLFYTSEGTLIKRFNVCTNTQLADFATLPTSPSFALRIRSNGEVLVAATSAVHRLSAAGTVLQSYPQSTCPGSSGQLFAMNLDPDGTTFWTTALGGSGIVCRINIATRALVSSFSTGLATNAGLAIFGEFTAALPPPSPPPSPAAVTSTKPC